jgi:hypothetical protein
MMEKGFCEIPIEQLVKADWNYKEDNPELEQKLLENIKRNGQIENIIVRVLDTGFYEVVNGNHRLDVLKMADFDSVYCFNLGQVTEAQAKRIAVETNETRFQSDFKSLAMIVNEVFMEFDDANLTMPFDDYDLEAMKNVSDADVENEPDIDDIEENYNKNFNIIIRCSDNDELQSVMSALSIYDGYINGEDFLEIMNGKV